MKQATKPQVDLTVEGDPLVQALVMENVQLRLENAQLQALNERFKGKLSTLRDGIAVLAERIKTEAGNGSNE